MLILQIESSSELCSVALARDGELLLMEINPEPYKHGRDINLLIKSLMEKSGYKLSEIDAISINKGPGSYTALRIGMSTAKGLCFGLDIPLVAPLGLEILIDHAISKYPDEEYYVPLIDARRMEVYTVDPVTDLTGPVNYKSLILDENSYASYKSRRVCFIGNGAEKWKAIWPAENQWISDQVEINAGMMTGISHRFIQTNNISDLFAVTPLYIKMPNITKSKKEYFN